VLDSDDCTIGNTNKSFAGSYCVLWNSGLGMIRSAVALLQAVGTLYNTAILRNAMTSNVVWKRLQWVPEED